MDERIEKERRGKRKGKAVLRAVCCGLRIASWGRTTEGWLAEQQNMVLSAED
jgi:GTP-dependent phosphoenolpyruvate carboxykinase